MVERIDNVPRENFCKRMEEMMYLARLNSNKRQVIYSISDAAKKLGMSVRMIREYEKYGLIKPCRNPSNGYRLFSKEDIQWIQCIRNMIHQDGISIKGIRRLLSVLPCWEIKGCPKEIREKCQASTDTTLPCWVLASKNCKNGDKCRTCKVYLEYKKD